MPVSLIRDILSQSVHPVKGRSRSDPDTWVTDPPRRIGDPVAFLSTDMGNSEAWGKEVTLPWQETSPMSERKRFVDLHLQGEHSIAELCRGLTCSPV